MKAEQPLHERLFTDPVYRGIVRILGYDGCQYRDLWTRLKPLTDEYGQQRVETATAHVLTYDKQFTVKPPPLAQVMLRAVVRKLAFGILGPAPDHPWYAAWTSGERVPLPWEKPEPMAEEKAAEPTPEAPTPEPELKPAKPKPTKAKKATAATKAKPTPKRKAKK